MEDNVLHPYIVIANPIVAEGVQLLKALAVEESLQGACYALTTDYDGTKQMLQMPTNQPIILITAYRFNLRPPFEGPDGISLVTEWFGPSILLFENPHSVIRDAVQGGLIQRFIIDPADAAELIPGLIQQILEKRAANLEGSND